MSEPGDRSGEESTLWGSEAERGAASEPAATVVSPDAVLSDVPGANPVSSEFGELVMDRAADRDELLQVRSIDDTAVYTFYHLSDDDPVYLLVFDDPSGTQYYELARDTAVSLIDEVADREQWGIHVSDAGFGRLFPAE
jgi:hypothetical protein